MAHIPTTNERPLVHPHTSAEFNPTRRPLLRHSIATLLVVCTALLGAANSATALEPQQFSDLVAVPSAGSEPFLSVFVLPLFVVDQTPFQDTTTLWAVRNEEDVTVSVDVTYFNRLGDAIASETFGLFPRETLTRNIRDVPGFPGITDYVDGSVFFSARRIDALSERTGRISIDSFTVDSANNFANGGKVHNLTDLCDTWSVRFLDFGTGPSLIDVFTESQGAVLAPPTATVTLYEQDGTFLTTFDVFEDRDTFTIDIAAHTQVRFGVAEIEFPFSNYGLVSVRHSAFGRFSVGHEAYCSE